MKFSELWLREYIETTSDSRSLYSQMTMSGLEVKTIRSVSDTFSGVFVGKIVACNNHTNKNEFLETKVDIGREQPINIICKAPNCRHGMLVAVAILNEVKPGDFKIKVKSLSMESSEGILCSFSDLGIANEDPHSIIELPIDAPIGEDIREYMRLDDNIIEIGVTSNRSDCLSMIGIARDVAVFNNIKYSIPEIPSVLITTKDILPIQVDIPEICPRYAGRLITEINVKARTPLWMKEKLRRCDVRSINAVIDISNYVLLELGQPTHIFDKDQIEGGIIVRMSKKKEIFESLNENKVKLNSKTPVVSDNNKVLSIGGFFCGKHASINDQTKTIFIECAFFNPKDISKQTRYYKLHTDSSYRYERGVDPMLQRRAIERISNLFIDICGGKAGPVIDIISKSNFPHRSTIKLSRRKLDRLIGHCISDVQVNDILCRLGCKVITDQDGWKITAPSWRFDINIEEDLVEEVVRVYGYNNIPKKPGKIVLKTRNQHNSILSLNRVKTMLNDKGYQEVITYSFVNSNFQQLIHPGEKALVLPDSICNDMSVMRLSLWTGLLGTVIYNQNRQHHRIRIFESGLCFIPDEKADLGIRQDFMLAGAISGNLYKEHWDIKKSVVDFYDMKGDLESIIDLTGKLSKIQFRKKSIPALHPGQCSAIYLDNECIGFIGVVHPKLEHKFDLNSRTVIFELKWNKISERLIPYAQEISRFPTNRRDIAVVVPENVPASDILDECKKVSPNYIIDVNLFDVYRGKNIIKGYKSLAISLILQSTSHTLEDKEVSNIVFKCIETLKKRFRADLR